MWLRSVLSIWVVAACSSGESSPGDDLAQGDQIFRDICAKCHGADGRGGLPMTPGGPKPRDLTDPVWQASRSDAEIETQIRDGKLPMPPYKTVLTPHQIRAAVAKVRRLKTGARP